MAVYARFAETGRAASVPELAKQLGVAEALIRTGLRELAAGRHLVLDDQDNIVMAHPFSWLPRAHQGMISCDIGGGLMADVLVRDVPEEVLAGVDAHAARLGLSRVEYIRRRLAADAATSGEAVSVADLRSFSEAAGDLADPQVMGDAWQ